PRGCVSGIEADGFLEGTKGAAEVLDTPEVPAFQIAAISVQVHGSRPGVNRSSRRGEPRLHRLDDARGNLVLNRENIDRLSVEPLRPELVSACDIGELGGDTHPPTCRPNAAFEYVTHRECASDRNQVVAAPACT